MISKTYKIKGMHCASCSGLIERTFKKTEGVHSVEVNYGTETAKVSFDETRTNPESLSKKIEPLGYSIIVPTAENMGMSAGEHMAYTAADQSKKEKLAEVAAQKNYLIRSTLFTKSSSFLILLAAKKQKMRLNNWPNIPKLLAGKNIYSLATVIPIR